MKEGLAFGLIAGLVFAVAETIAVVSMGDPALMPLRMFASILLGRDALEATPVSTVVLAGSAVHLALSGAFGLFYGTYSSALTTETRRSWGRQALLGLLFGGMLWLVNFHVFGRAFFPWFLDAPQGPQLVMHALFYGLPLALMYVASERRVPTVQRPLAYR